MYRTIISETNTTTNFSYLNADNDHLMINHFVLFFSHPCTIQYVYSKKTIWNEEYYTICQVLAPKENKTNITDTGKSVWTKKEKETVKYYNPSRFVGLWSRGKDNKGHIGWMQ